MLGKGSQTTSRHLRLSSDSLAHLANTKLSKNVANLLFVSTATELARTAGRALPSLAGELRTAADIFNDVTYGEQPATEPQYRMIAELDGRLGKQTAAPLEGAGDAIASQPWAEVR